MAPQTLSSLSAVRKQHLFIEFSSLKYACPQGPYAPSILRFQISLPPSYPSLPPLVTFSTDIFHPLIAPLTTYMYTTDVQDNGTVSATDEERLPPGGFSLRHGFPAWFGRASRRSGTQRTPVKDSPQGGSSQISTPESVTSSPKKGHKARGRHVSTYEVLKYIRSTFDEEEILDKVPLEAAGNPGAWHALRTHRVRTGNLADTWHDGLSGDEGGDAKPKVKETIQKPSPTSRRLGEWNWDGVWEERVKKGIEGSLAGPVLYGSLAGDDLIKFLNMDEAEIETIMENMRKSAEAVEPQRRGVV